MGKYICQRPIHPGELLKEETEADYYADSDAFRGSFGYQCFATDADAA